MMFWFNIMQIFQKSKWKFQKINIDSWCIQFIKQFKKNIFNFEKITNWNLHLCWCTSWTQVSLLYAKYSSSYSSCELFINFSSMYYCVKQFKIEFSSADFRVVRKYHVNHFYESAKCKRKCVNENDNSSSTICKFQQQFCW